MTATRSPCSAIVAKAISPYHGGTEGKEQQVPAAYAVDGGESGGRPAWT
jgi:hypothetical protein